MKCLIVEISKVGETHFDDTNEHPVFTMAHYQSFFLKSGIDKKMQAEMSIRCGVCSSFVVPTAVLYDLLNEPEFYIDETDREEWDGEFEALHESLDFLTRSLTEEITVSDEEWESYFTKGTPQLNPLNLKPDGVHIPEWASNPIRLKYDDVFFSFGECESCNRLYRGHLPDIKEPSSSDHCNNNQKGNKKMAMTVEIKGNKLCIEIDLEKPTPSASGKTLVVASTRGNAVTTAMVDGKPITIGLNAYIKL